VVIFNPPPPPLYSWGKSPRYQLDRSLGNPRSVPDDSERIKILPHQGLEHRPLCRPARGQFLYRLRYLGSLRGHSTHLNEQNSPSQHMSRNQCLLTYGRCSRDLYTRCSMWFPCILTQLLVLRRTEVSTLSRISGFTPIS
jgi:hypothetical protein